MSEDDSNRLYGEKEISALLKRAIELQEADATPAIPGLTLTEIERIAAEVGVDPRYVQAAAVDLRRAAFQGSRFQRGSLAVEGGCIVEGEVTNEQWEEMVQAIRRTYGQTGRTERLGDALEWMSFPLELVAAHVTVSPRKGHTKIQIEQRYDNVQAVCYPVGLLIAFLGAALLVENLDWPQLVELSMAGGVFGGSLVLMRSLLVHWTRRQRGKLEKLLKRLSALVKASKSVPAAEAPRLEQPHQEPAAALQLPDESAYQQVDRGARRQEKGRAGI